MIEYVTDVGGVAPDDLRDFFVDWPKPLSPDEEGSDPKAGTTW